MVPGGCGLMHKLSKKHFDIFVKSCKYWVNYFGLSDWEWNYFFESDKDNDRASVHYQYDPQIAAVYLYNEWVSEPTPYQLKLSGFHEVVHVLLAPISELGEKYFTDAMTSKRNHIVTNRLVNTIFQEHKDKC